MQAHTERDWHWNSPPANVKAHEQSSIDGRWTSKGLTVEKTVKQEVNNDLAAQL